LADKNNDTLDCFNASMKKNINRRIKEVKKSLKREGETFSKSTLASDVGLSPSSLSHILGNNGTRQLTLWEYYRFCIYLKTPPEDLVPIIFAMTDEEKSNETILDSLKHDTLDLDKQEQNLIRLYRSFSKEQRKFFMSIAVSFHNALG